MNSYVSDELQGGFQFAFRTGEELVSKYEIAVSELVKNSYDADATLVEVSISEDSIAISDNGIGMSLDTVRDS